MWVAVASASAIHSHMGQTRQKDGTYRSSTKEAGARNSERQLMECLKMLVFEGKTLGDLHRGLIFEAAFTS